MIARFLGEDLLFFVDCLPMVALHAMAMGYSLLFTLAGYWLFATRKEKG